MCHTVGRDMTVCVGHSGFEDAGCPRMWEEEGMRTNRTGALTDSFARVPVLRQK